MGWIVLGVLAQSSLVLVAPSPWWVPNLTCVGLVLGIRAAPERWLPCAALAGLLLSAWALRHPMQTLVTCLLLGWGIRVLAVQWDLKDGRALAAAAAASALLASCGALWSDARWSLGLVWAACLQAAVTAGAAALAHRVLRLRGLPAAKPRRRRR